MPYAILRFQKKKSGGVAACYKHNERKKEAYKSNPDINPQMGPDNYHLVLPKQTYQREVRRMIQAAGCKTRCNSPVMVETIWGKLCLVAKCIFETSGNSALKYE